MTRVLPFVLMISTGPALAREVVTTTSTSSTRQTTADTTSRATDYDAYFMDLGAYLLPSYEPIWLDALSLQDTCPYALSLLENEPVPTSGEASDISSLVGCDIWWVHHQVATPPELGDDEDPYPTTLEGLGENGDISEDLLEAGTQSGYTFAPEPCYPVLELLFTASWDRDGTTVTRDEAAWTDWVSYGELAVPQVWVPANGQDIYAARAPLYVVDDLEIWWSDIAAALQAAQGEDGYVMACPVH